MSRGSLILTLTRECDLRCSYCPTVKSGWPNLNPEQIRQAMDLFDSQEFDLVSLDYLLPGNLNGLDVYKHIRSRNEQIPIIFVSGNIGFLESMKEISSIDRYMDHISKPCENIVYVNTVNKWLAVPE